jgi:hypothetical protein
MQGVFCLPVSFLEAVCSCVRVYLMYEGKRE